MSIRIGLVGCGKSKLDHPVPAAALYTGSLFRKAAAYARREYDAWYILSAEHILLHPSQVIAPYDRTVADLTTAGQHRWATEVDWRLRGDPVSGFDGRYYGYVGLGAAMQRREWIDIYVHAGATYLAPLERIFAGFNDRVRIHRPMAGMQIGEQLHWYKQMESQQQFEEDTRDLGERVAFHLDCPTFIFDFLTNAGGT